MMRIGHKGEIIYFEVRQNIENTRLVLNIAQVYPARLIISKITRLDFRANQDKLELYSTLTLVFYLSYYFNSESIFFTFLY